MPSGDAIDKRAPIPDRLGVRILFCGEEFPDAARCTASSLSTDPGVEVVVCKREDVATEIERADIAVPLMTRLDADIIARGAKRLRLVLQFGVGLEGVDERACAERGVLVARIPADRTGNATSTAEMAVYLVLAALRRVNAMADSLKARTLGTPMGTQLKGLNVLIVGWGNIAREVAVRIAPFGVTLSATRRRPWTEEDAADEAGSETAGALALLGDRKGSGEKDLMRMLNDADVVILACKQTRENVGMVGDAFLASMQPGATLVNVARGGLFDRDAVLAALETGHLGFLASDVAWSEPVDTNDAVVRHPRSYFTPHVGGITGFAYGIMGGVVAEEARRVRRGELPSDRVEVINEAEAVKNRAPSLREQLSYLYDGSKKVGEPVRAEDEEE